MGMVTTSVTCGSAPRRPADRAGGSYDGLAAVCALTSMAEAQAFANE
jgi:hypothetical protein